jgi:hypothetical protein
MAAMYRAAFVLVAACGFHGAALVADGGPPGDGQRLRDATIADTRAAIDAAVDAPPCTMHPSGTPVSPGYVGGTGGTVQPAVVCAGHGVPVGLELDMTQAPLANHGNELAVVALSVRCGTIIGGATVLGEVINRIGDMGNCSGYNAPIASGEKLCPPGAAITAIDANELDTSLFNTVVLTCSDGSAVPFPSSGAFTNKPQHVACAAGSVVVGFEVRAACGQDQLALECAPLSCD